MSATYKDNLLKWTELKGRAVVDIATAKRVGSVDDLVIDPQTRQIVGLSFKPGLFSADQTVPVSVIGNVGQDAVTLRLEGLNADSPIEQSLRKLPTLSAVINNGVVTEGGKYIGAISNIKLGTQPLAVVGYEISEGGLFSKKHAFDVTPQVHYGEKLVIIPDKLVDAITPSA